jgi:hypothetical protein
MNERLRDHAAAVLADELTRRRSAFTSLTAASRSAVERACVQAVAAAVQAVLDEALREPLLTTALWSIYGSEPPGATVGIRTAATAD